MATGLFSWCKYGTISAASLLWFFFFLVQVLCAPIGTSAGLGSQGLQSVPNLGSGDLRGIVQSNWKIGEADYKLTIELCSKQCDNGRVEVANSTEYTCDCPPKTTNKKADPTLHVMWVISKVVNPDVGGTRLANIVSDITPTSTRLSDGAPIPFEAQICPALCAFNPDEVETYSCSCPGLAVGVPKVTEFAIGSTFVHTVEAPASGDALFASLEQQTVRQDLECDPSCIVDTDVFSGEHFCNCSPTLKKRQSEQNTNNACEQTYQNGACIGDYTTTAPPFLEDGRIDRAVKRQSDNNMNSGGNDNNAIEGWSRVWPPREE